MQNKITYKINNINCFANKTVAKVTLYKEGLRTIDIGRFKDDSIQPIEVSIKEKLNEIELDFDNYPDDKEIKEKVLEYISQLKD